MGIKAPHTAPNSVFGEYHKIISATFSPDAAEWNILVGFYVSAESRHLNADPVYTRSVRLPVGYQMQDGGVVEDPRPGLYDLLLRTIFYGTNAQNHLDDTSAIELGALKTLKKAEIDRGRAHANQDHFMFRGHKIPADPVSMLDIQTTMQGVLARGALREDWPGGWIAEGDVPVPIPDVETWLEFHSAMESTGLANLERARALKVRVDAAITAHEVDSIHWNMDLSAPYTPPEPAPNPEQEPLEPEAPPPPPEEAPPLPPPPNPFETQPVE